MNRSQVSSVERLQLTSRFEGLRAVLASDDYADHLEKPLAYWVQPGDRGLPLALLGWPLGDIVKTPFDELRNTPGIGRKKLDSLVMLLARAAKTDPTTLPDLSVHLPESDSYDSPSDVDATDRGFDGTAVSEIVWAQWRAAVVRAGLADEPLGRLAPSLKNLTRVIWDTPLGAYTDCTLADLRAMKTHGEKRVRGILEVFHGVHSLIGNVGTQDHLVVRMVPRCIDRVERWVGHSLQRPGVPEPEEIFQEFASPLLAQIGVDAPEQIVRLAEIRLGIAGAIVSVRQAARNLGLTRARVYQLLNEINDIMVVRWPTGRHQAYELLAKLRTESGRIAAPPDLGQFQAAVELFYPSARRGAAGPLEPAGTSASSADEEVELEATA